MASLQPLSSKHRCQIDCTNHDEVISSLELKSKDLYYFWVFMFLLRGTMNGSITNTILLLISSNRLK